MMILIYVLVAGYLWLIYEAWRAPMVREESDDSITYLEDPKTLKDVFKRK